MKLNNGALMPICICTSCKNESDLTSPDVQSNIMEAVKNGWDLEIFHMKTHPDQYPDFTPQKEEQLRNFYKGLSIVGYAKDHKVGV